MRYRFVINNSSNTPVQLGKRLQCNTLSSHDLNEFVLGIINPARNEHVLDVGCGLGKQLIPISEKVAEITGVEVSEEILNQLKKNLGARSNVKLIMGSMDSLGTLLPEQRFDLIYSCYALYYSTDVSSLIRQIADCHLKSSGRFFVIAPDVGNNSRWFDDLQNIFPVPSEILESSWMSRNQILPPILAAFERVFCYKFGNNVVFNSLDELMKYYDGCGAYCRQDRRAEAEAFFTKIFKTESKYTMEKRALGILAFGKG